MLPAPIPLALTQSRELKLAQEEVSRLSREVQDLADGSGVVRNEHQKLQEELNRRTMEEAEADGAAGSGIGHGKSRLIVSLELHSSMLQGREARRKYGKCAISERWFVTASLRGCCVFPLCGVCTMSCFLLLTLLGKTECAALVVKAWRLC